MSARRLKVVDDVPRFNRDAQAVYHDHLEGSAHCVECGGYCRITDPTQAALTSIVRSLFESESLLHESPVLWQIMRALERNGVRVEHLRRRAKELYRSEDGAQPAAASRKEDL